MSDTPVSENLQGMNNQESHSIYIVGGEKGGIGKSFFCRIMVEYFIRKGWGEAVALIDADPTIDDVSSVFETQCQRIIFSDSKYQQEEPSLIFKTAKNHTVVVNLPSNISRQFDHWMLTNGVLEESAKQNYGAIYYFFLSDGCFRSVNHFIKQVEKYKEKLPHILVLNPGRLTCSGTFHYLENYKPLMKVIKENRIPILMCPELPTDLQFFCDENQVQYEEALMLQEFFLDKQRISSFLSRIDEFFNGLFIHPDQEHYSNINQLANLENIVNTQEAQVKKNHLPIPSREALLGLVS